MLDKLLKPEIEELIANRDLRGLRNAIADWTPPELADLIDSLPSHEDIVVFRLLPRALATRVFEFLDSDKQQALIEAMAKDQRFLIELLNSISPDDRTALLEELPSPVAQRLLNLLSPEEKQVAITLLGYPERSVGRLMTTEYLAIRPEWTVQQALDHIRKHGRDSETLNVIYIVDESSRLLDDLSIHQIILADPQKKVADLLDNRFVSLVAIEDQESAVQAFRNTDYAALPVTDSDGTLLGIVTIDDVLDVAEEEATEDIHKIGGSGALTEPYLNTPLTLLMRKRAGWLVVLFFGEMLTISAMGFFEDKIAQAVVLALFVPLIISSGGNTGSQAATLVIRAMSVGEVGLRDWWRVLRREAISGLTLGTILGVMGVFRIGLWEMIFSVYGEHWPLVAATIGLSLIGVVLWGTLAGSMLPFLMRRLGADPATSSAPLVATLVDVTGLIIYFSIASLVLSGTLL